MPEYEINGVQVHFPFEPYEVQRNYMSKVIEALQGSTNAVLESPTGTGKTLCLLCSSLAWLQTKKAQVQASKLKPLDMLKEQEGLVQPANCLNNLQDDFSKELDSACGAKGGAWGVPKIIYASRTHSQLSQAMAEMKRTTYSYMKAAVVGSRDQLCIHPDVTKESGNSNKIHMCRAHVQARTCGFYQRVDQKKDHPDFREASVMDIEDLVTAGKKHKCCPYFLSKEMVEKADIIFMPYNYLLDPKARKANNIELHNSIVILDEAHNVEKMCEESASIQLKSSDVALCMEEVTNIMRKLDDDKNLGFVDDVGGAEDGQTFTIEDLATLKELLMKLEENIDNLKADTNEGTTHPGNFIFDLLNRSGFNESNSDIIRKLLDDLIQWITAATQAQGKGISSNAGGLSLLSDVLTIVFAGKGGDFHERVRRCYKVHIGIEEQKKEKGYKKNDGWTAMGKAPTPSVKNNAKVVSYWCFNPGFGMTQVLNKNVRSVILTSGTLAPLKPLISELGIPVNVRLENPHIIKKSQVYVRIVSHGPDNEQLISNYENRNNPKYVASLGRTIMNFCPVIPSGLLVFFPSYFIMNKCMDDWQASGLWSQISARKPIFIEPRTKEEFTVVMNNYYAKINDPNGKGAIFMAVCRGKVSEGLDFADMNGRGVIITGLPFPPVKDPRVVLKRRYLEENRTRENEILSGAEWYGLEATRAVNQAIGRVIRHKDDYGAILLCDQRFNDRRQKDQLSKWLQGHLQQSFNPGFGTIMKELSMFFKEAAKTLPKPSLKPISYEEGTSKASEMLQGMKGNDLDDRVPNYKIALSDKNDFVENANKVQSWSRADYERNNIKVEFPHGKDFFGGLKTESSSIDFNDVSSYNNNAPNPLVTIHKRAVSPAAKQNRPKKYKIIPNIKQEVINLDDSDEKSPEKFTAELTKENPLSLINSKAEDTVTVWRRRNKFKENYQTLEEIEAEAKALPTCRVEFLKLMKTDVDHANYKGFLTALSDYRKNQNLELLLSRLKKCFDMIYLFPYLMEMKRFVVDSHKSRFDAEIPSFIRSKLIN
ncbi:regulator of telomere elongation helicase 1 homolog [Culicoides brevitarsis]|uniref:regulator of telomere elongation helicase 1 homolog n=1 Tax=Culicoides brevitarsis TaxID=469753 RepID=UPI00307BAECD